MKNKLSKRIISLLLVAFMIISFVPMTKIEAEAASFTPRYKAPSKTGWYANYNRNNCVTYAKYRANEILGNTSAEGIFTNGNTPIKLGQYYKNAKTMGYSVGSQPKPGAVIVSSGHVAIVEAVTDSKIIWTEGCYSWVSKVGGTTFDVVLNGGTASNPTNPNNKGTWFCRREVTYNKSTGKPDKGFSGTWYGYIYLVKNGTVISDPPKNDESGSKPVSNNRYNKNAKFSTGEYKSTATSGVNMRSGAGTNYNKLGKLVPYNGQINITETNGNWGKGTYGGYTGWVCLDYFSKISIPNPTTPKITSISEKDIAQGGICTIQWGGSSNATRYAISVNNGPEVNCGANTSYSLVLSEAKTYTFKVKAYNSVNKGSSWSNTTSCVSHAPSTVTFVDSDGTLIDKVIVDYGKNATAPAPSKEGYTFQGWNGSTYNITKDVTLKAQYTINTYNVKFWGTDDNQLGETQKVKYGEDATPPTDTEAPEGYKFVRWSNENYKNVFTAENNKTINIYAIYEWANESIPLTCTITDAYRDKYGYHVLYDIKNNVSTSQTGRAIISLKTAEGKLIHTTESKTFSIAANSSKTNIDEFFECQQTATIIEIIIIDSYSTGVPLSKNVSANVENGLGWSDWAEGSAPEGVEAEERLVYSYRNKETKTTDTNTLEGWELIDTTSKVWNWTGWSTTVPTAINTPSLSREIESTQKTVWDSSYPVYIYQHHYKAGAGDHRWEAYDHKNLGGYTKHTYSSKTIWERNGSSECTGVARYKGPACVWGSCQKATIWFYDSQYTEYVNKRTETQYRYRDTTYEYTFSRWGEWSDWSETVVTATDTKQVKTQTQYRTNSGVEDTTGKELSRTYNVGSQFANKQVTLFVYKYDAASDYTDEYVGQTTVGNDGSCTFTIKLREEPTIKTGDFTFALGIEGTTNTFVVDTLPAPVPEYTVTFYDTDGTILETQTVKEGNSAVLPAIIPSREGYNFLGWNESLTNIKQDMDIFPEMEKKTYQVIFVDWENQFLQVSTFEHGDVLTVPEHTYIEGYSFEGWDQVINGNSIVTSNMVVSAVYEANTYTVKFCDFDGNVIDSQEVAYNDSAVLPTNPEKEGTIFAGWYNPEEYQYVDHDVSIFPAYYFEETCETPEANYSSGEFSESLELTLSSDDENAVIYYYLDGDQESETIYTEPITIGKTTAVTFYATALGKNDSEPVTNFYCINKKFTPSKWMLYSDLPTDVKENPDAYILESKTGYRFMNTVSTGVVAEANEYVQNQGYQWKYSGYSDYTAWQDEEIVNDNSLINFEIETQEVEDTAKQRYKFTRYSYTDAEGNTAYSYTAVDGYNCTLEETYLELNDPASSPVGFFEGNTSVFYWEIDGGQWFNRTKVNGVKTQYRSRYTIRTYYKWTEWDFVAPENNETREYETDTLYRYDNKIYHLISLDNNGYNYIIVEEGTLIPVEKIETVSGYNFIGLYTDETYENQFSLNTPITESLTLYPKYEPKEYTVTFQMEGGLELDTQTVKYMEAASAPDSFNIDGYVFGGWDKDFDCITEDLVVTGKYFKEEEYARISLTNTVYDMYQGNDTTLTYTISPADLSDEAVEWSSSNPEIVSVDETGKITALSPGEATITAMVTKTREKATCVVTVNEDISNFIIVKPESSLNHDDLGYLRRIGFNTSVASASEEFRNKGLLFYNINGTQLGADGVVGTGTVIKLMNGETLLDSETIIVTGDMTGDGLLNNRDVAMVNRYLVGKVEPQECQVLALDLNGDGYINNKDAAMAARYLVGKEAII